MNVHIDISAGMVAWYGAIIATVGASKNIYDMWNNRSRLKIEWQFNMHMQNETDKFFVITAINKGKRPIKITHVAVKQYGTKEVVLLGHSFTHEELRILTDDRPATTYPVIQGDLGPNNLWYVMMYDARGREYRRYNPESTPFYKRWYYHVFKPRNNKKVDKK